MSDELTKELKLEILPKFLPLWETQSRYFILMGGRGAGRSTAASQYAVSKVASEDYFRCAIMRAIHSDIRHSIWREVMDRMDEQGVRDAFHITENDMHINYGENSIQAHGFKASSGSHSAKLKSLASYNAVIIEEAEEIGESEFMMLDDTLRTLLGDITLILCLNPPPKNHWMIQRWFDLEEHEEKGFYIPHTKSDDIVHVFGTFEDNLENLNRQTIQRYRNYKKTNSEYYWNMIEGLVPDAVRGKIYHGWEQIDRVPKEARLVRFGLDYGWFPDPAVAVSIHYLNGGYIIDELAYGTEIENEVLAGAIKDVSGYQNVLTIADSAEPKSIDEMRKYGIRIEGSEKGADSVNYGIKIVAGKRISVTKRSVNVWESYENYAWDEDKDGNPKGTPVHKWSHAPDAIRYGLTSLQTRNFGKPKVSGPNWTGYGKTESVKKDTGLGVHVNTPTIKR